MAQRPHLYRHGRPPAYAGACFAGHDDEARGTSGNDSVVSRQTLGQTTEVALYHDVVGEGQSVCLINGYRLSGAAWPRAFISRLSMWCSVISFDNRGTGRSDKPDDGYDFGNQARYVIGLLDDLGLPRGAATLVATGTHEVLVKSRNAAILASRIPNALLETLADLGHRAIWEAPEEIAELIGDFLTGPNREAGRFL